jgi:hypothetical protein
LALATSGSVFVAILEIPPVIDAVTAVRGQTVKDVREKRKI